MIDMTGNTPFWETDRDISRWKQPKHKHDGISALLAAQEISTGIHSIRLEKYWLDILVLNRQSKTTIITFHANLANRQTLKLPVFVGGSIAGSSANLIMIADPCLCRDATLSLAWFAGAADLPLQGILQTVIKHIIACLGSRNNIFFGASGGGFAAMYYGFHVPESLSVALNPQIIIRRYSESAVRRYLSACFDQARSLDQPIFDSDLYCEDLAELYRGGFANSVLYVQNSSDDHVSLHLQPFTDAVSVLPERRTRLAIHLGDWGSGHVPPPKSWMTEALSDAIAAEGDWPRVLNKYRTA